MATKSEVFNDRKCVTHPPPPYYQNIHTPASSSSTNSICVKYIGKPTSPLFSFLRNKEKRKTVLSHTRDIISPSNFPSSSIVPTVNACAAAISPEELSNLLQKPNIEGHTAINHALFTRLNRGRVINRRGDALRIFLGCPPDEVQVHDAGDVHKVKFNVCFCLRMFQKRLLMRQELGTEFIAAGRIWLFQIFSMAPDGLWRIFLSLSKESLPACPEAVLVIEAHLGKHDCAAPITIRSSIHCSHPSVFPTKTEFFLTCFLAPPRDLRVLPITSSQSADLQFAPQGSATDSIFTWRLKDWLLNQNTIAPLAIRVRIFALVSWMSSASSLLGIDYIGGGDSRFHDAEEREQLKLEGSWMVLKQKTRLQTNRVHTNSGGQSSQQKHDRLYENEIARV
ncbi:hypothetical protein BDR03DRAFT_979805 [Suillus americanus]|nr:hypothetical protein BDR03DRAFT_979805 [Suillus americanus]